MRNYLGSSSFIVFTLLSVSAFASAQCEAEPEIGATGKIVRRLTVDKRKPTEIGLSIKASVAGASWQTAAAEAAVITVFVDKKYSQDVLLFAGHETFDYTALLGEVVAGKHEIDLVLNSRRSAKGVGSVSVVSAKTYTVERGRKTDLLRNLAITNTPLIYIRPNVVDKFSDIPLITYYEILPGSKDAGKVRYTTIFTNEDGGTQTTALMARWGRATDIEWVYELSYRSGKIISEIFQGADHQTTQFNGKRVLGKHPVIYDVTENNNFADTGCSALRIANVPIEADLSMRSRETIMDENPWTYRIMAQEAIREGRVDPNRLGPNVIDDLRNYLYVEVYSENENAAISIDAMSADGAKSMSDLGDRRLRIERSGYQRIAARLPSPLSKLKTVALKCHRLSGEEGKCRNAQILRVITLDKNFLPVVVRSQSNDRRSIGTGGELVETIR